MGQVQEVLNGGGGKGRQGHRPEPPPPASPRFPLLGFLVTAFCGLDVYASWGHSWGGSPLWARYRVWGLKKEGSRREGKVTEGEEEEDLGMRILS